MQYIGFLKAAEKHISAKIFTENLHLSVKILQICMDLQDSVQRSLQNPAEKILQSCTDSQRSKTWVDLQNERAANDHLCHAQERSKREYSLLFMANCDGGDVIQPI